MAPELLLLPAVFANAEHRPVHARCLEVDVLECVSNVLFLCLLLMIFIPDIVTLIPSLMG